MTYTLYTYNGTTRIENTYEIYEDARAEGDRIWMALSAKDRLNYTDREAGHWFYINDDTENVTYDYLMELHPFEVYILDDDGYETTEYFARDKFDRAAELFNLACISLCTLEARLVDPLDFYEGTHYIRDE